MMEQGLRENKEKEPPGPDRLRSRRTSDMEVMGSTGRPLGGGGVRIRMRQSEPPILVDPLPSRVTCPTTVLG